MYKFIKSIFFTTSITFLVGCSPIPATEVDNPYTYDTRTYHESLDLGTPEAAVETFVEAYEAGDFFTVYLCLSGQAFFSWQGQFILLEYEGIANTEYKDQLRNEFIQYSLTHSGNWNRFVAFMNSARDKGALLFDFGNEVNILRTEQIDSAEVFNSFNRESPAVEVYAIAENIPGEVIFTLVQSATFRWRVHQVSIPGGDPEALPWAVPPLNEKVSIPDSPEESTSFLKHLANSLETPEASIEIFTDAFQRGDFHLVYLILTPFAQEVWADNLGRFLYGNLWKPSFNGSVDIGRLDDWEFIDTWYLFDLIMVQAQEQDALLIDLSGRINILDAIKAQTIEINKDYGELEVVEVEVIAEFVPGKVTFVMLQMPGGDWRVHQVVVAGGDRKIIPWSMPE